jgi:hypothetical protein
VHQRVTGGGGPGVKRSQVGEVGSRVRGHEGQRVKGMPWHSDHDREMTTPHRVRIVSTSQPPLHSPPGLHSQIRQSRTPTPRRRTAVRPPRSHSPLLACVPASAKSAPPSNPQ